MSIEGERRIRLASASPRRHELFNLTGWEANISPVEVDEVLSGNEDPAQFARRLALEKALAASRNAPISDIILAADTIVVYEQRILGKPSDVVEARQFLLELRGKSHQVITSLVLIDRKENKQLIDLCETEVPMRRFSIGELEDYVASGEPMDKAGAYGIQDVEFHPVAVEKMEGCYANVMGLPLCHLLRSMQRFGIQSREDVPSRCRAYTRYDCQVFQDILSDKK